MLSLKSMAVGRFLQSFKFITAYLMFKSQFENLCNGPLQLHKEILLL